MSKLENRATLIYKIIKVSDPYLSCADLDPDFHRDPNPVLILEITSELFLKMKNMLTTGILYF